MQSALTKAVGELPRLALRELVSCKLENAGVPASDAAVDSIVEAALRGDDAVSLDWEADVEKQFNITFDERDTKELGVITDRLLEKIPQTVNDFTEAMTRSMVNAVRGSWPDLRGAEEFETEAFRFNLENRWGRALDWLRMLLWLAREIGATEHQSLSRSKSKKGRLRRYLLSRLHARTCQVTAEIIHLIEGGFADAATARWRTLHEIGVVATLLSDRDEALAERYLLHENVELKRSLEQYEAVHLALGYKPPSKAERSKIDDAFARVVDRFGKPFAGEYGWAAEALGLKRPTFADLEKAAGRANLRGHYKMASHPVHAGVRGLHFKFGVIGGEDVVLTGASNAGFEDAGQGAAQDLALTTILLLQPRRGIDDLVHMKVCMELSERATKAFVSAGRKLAREERQRQKSKTPRRQSRKTGLGDL